MSMIGLAGCDFKKALQAAGCKAIDPASATYIEHALSTLPRAAMIAAKIGGCPFETLGDPRVCAFEPIIGVNIRTMVAEGVTTCCAHAVRRHLYMLATLCVTYTECQDVRGGVSNKELVYNVLEIMSRLQTGDAGDVITFNSIMVDDIVALLVRLGSVTDAAKRHARKLTINFDQHIYIILGFSWGLLGSTIGRVIVSALARMLTKILF